MSQLSLKAQRFLSWAPALVGAAGMGLILWLAAGRWAHAGASVLAILALAGVSVLAWLRARKLLRAGTNTPVSGAPSPSAGTFTPLAGAFDAMPEPVLIVSADSPAPGSARRVISANRAARDLLKIPAEGAALVAAIRDPKVLEQVDAALQRGADGEVEFAPGGLHDLHWRAEVRAMPEGAAGARLAMVHLRDETEARRLERMRADFMANASHELRSPLASLTGFIETLKGAARDDPAARERFLDIMAVQGDRMGRLISDLLSLSRIELDEHIPPEGVADLNQVAADVADALTPQLARRGLRLTLEGAGAGEAVVAGDRDQLVQVVQNLAENALKYSPDGGEIRFELVGGYRPLDPVNRTGGLSRAVLLRPAHQPGVRFIALKVRDRGPGIEPQKLPRLTERFYRVEGQKSGDRLGTGLGLAIVKHIVNRHRGGLIVESAPGEGSIFTVYLPQAAKSSTADDDDRSKTVMQAS
ncbi:MAG: PAS domain-containing protein [Caulobacteraceae bacterium]|nr:PAS domain-containing protein [Caulobacteraceae bacterium]